MKIQIENVTVTEELENNSIIERVSAKIEGLTRIEEAFNAVSGVLAPIVFWKCGRGANHIWVSNWKNERLMIITETRKN
jgi:hypothetical protein